MITLIIVLILLIVPFIKSYVRRLDAIKLQKLLDKEHSLRDKYNANHRTDYTTREVMIRLMIWYYDFNSVKGYDKGAVYPIAPIIINNPDNNPNNVANKIKNFSTEKIYFLKSDTTLVNPSNNINWI